MSNQRGRNVLYFNLPADTLVYEVNMIANTKWLEGIGIVTDAYGTIKVGATYHKGVPGNHAVGKVIAPSPDHACSLAKGKEVGSFLDGGSP